MKKNQIGRLRQSKASSEKKPPKRAIEHKLEYSINESSLVRRTADILRQEILRVLPRGRVFLGSELDLIRRLDVSRPTFRQAARLLQHEQLLLIKRGANGGFFSDSPSEEVVTRMASVFLRTKGTTLQQINEACGPLITEGLIIIAGNGDSGVRRRVHAFWTEASARNFESDARARARLVLDFEKLIGELCGNPALSMMLNVMREIIRSHQFDYFDMNVQRTTEYLTFVEKIATAVLDGDIDICRIVCQRFFAGVDNWLPDEDVTPKVSSTVD